MKSIFKSVLALPLLLLLLSTTNDFKLVELNVNLEYPWGMAWVDSDRMLITQKNGKLFLVDVVKNIQKEIQHSIPSVQVGQGGLLDVAFDGEYIWLTCSISQKGKFTTALYKSKLDGLKLTNTRLIFEAEPYSGSTKHFGSRIEIFNNHIYMTIGEREGGMIAQDYTNSIGSVIRVNKDGMAPADNPYSKNNNWLPELYQIGVRNPQGITINSLTNEILISNHGPKGGDFVGPVSGGTNYGWKKVAWGGTNYSGTIIGDGNAWEPGFIKPYYIWTPSIGIGGIKFYNGDIFPKWKNQLLVASLKFKYLSVLYFENNKFKEESVILKDEIGRIRDIEVSSNGYIYLIADEKATKLYKLMPIM